jgi:hypothetical protein
VDIPAAVADRDATVLIMPGLADPNDTGLWEADLSIRLYAGSPVLVDGSGPGEFTLAPGQSAAFRFPLGNSPWPLGDGFFLLGNVVVDAKGTLWSREVRLPEPGPPIMR